MTGVEAVIGLEVHARLRTRTKIFCPCEAAPAAEPNTRTCPVCRGRPGALPVLNARAVDLGVTAALALGCEVRLESAFDRKNYVYPDLPRGYQITQHARPLAVGGSVRGVALERLHLEEDAARIVDGGDVLLVDDNRAGIPLVEIVTRPEIRTPAQAVEVLRELRAILRDAGVCDGAMEEGSLRVDANVSVRASGGAPGERVEVKNLNSFRHVEQALSHEIERQAGSREPVVRETRLWDEKAHRTVPTRDKEESADYRYLPEPDLPVLRLDPARVEALRRAMPELPEARRARYREALGLPPGDAARLVDDPDRGRRLEDAVAAGGPARTVSNLVLNVEGELPAPGRLARLARLVEEGTLSFSAAKGLVPELLAGADPDDLVRERGLGRRTDEPALRASVERVLAAHPAEAASYRAGRRGVLTFLVGQVMRETAGRADPRRARALLEEILG